MNKERVKKLLPVMQAYVDGKQIQHQWAGECKWYDTNLADVSFESAADYRIKPEPRLRAWKPEEVPVGAQFRVNSWNPQERATISHVAPSGIYTSGGRHGGFRFGFEEASRDCSHSTDNGKTWHPCGVQE